MSRKVARVPTAINRPMSALDPTASRPLVLAATALTTVNVMAMTAKLKIVLVMTATATESALALTTSPWDVSALIVIPRRESVPALIAEQLRAQARTAIAVYAQVKVASLLMPILVPSTSQIWSPLPQPTAPRPRLSARPLLRVMPSPLR